MKFYVILYVTATPSCPDVFSAAYRKWEVLFKGVISVRYFSVTQEEYEYIVCFLFMLAYLLVSQAGMFSSPTVVEKVERKKKKRFGRLGLLVPEAGIGRDIRTKT